MTDTQDMVIARLEQVLDRLERAGGRTLAPFAAVDPDGYPSHVAAGELIESAWGNAVVDNLHRIGDQANANSANIIAAKPQGYHGYRATTDITPAGVFGTGAFVDVAPAAAGTWLVAATLVFSTTANDILIARIRGGATDIGPWVSNRDTTANKRETITFVDTHVVNTTANTRFEISAYAFAGGLSMLAGSRVSATFLGLHL